MTVTCAALMCHAPIVIPEIAGPRGSECARTTQAMHDVARAIVAHEPDVVALVSPHAPRHREAWGIVDSATIAGSFERFGRGDLAIEARGAPDQARALALAARAHGLAAEVSRGHDLDHGALVPLMFLVQAGYRGPVLVVALPHGLEGSEDAFGKSIAQAARDRSERWAVLASGDMSHRLQPGAPAGFDPRAADFDRTFTERIRKGEFKKATRIDAALRERAAEDVVQSTHVALSAVGYAAHGVRVLSYEGPYGVGYLEAVLFSDRAPSEKDVGAPPAALVDIARLAITHELTGQRVSFPALPRAWDAPRAVFVTLRSPSGELRGCIGRTEPLLASLTEEVIDCAVSAATRDPRMPSVEPEEIESLHIDVSVLDPPEPVDSVDALDPARFGVVVSQGARRGVLLPQVDGVDDVKQQVEIAMRKGRVHPQQPYQLARFRVHKVGG